MVFKNLNNLLIKLINAQKSKKRVFVHFKTKLSLKLVHILKNEGLILGYTCFEFKSKNFIKIFLKYTNFLPVVSKIKLISKPSKRIFFKKNSILKFNANLGLILLHTNKGLLTHKQCILLNIGGEAIFFIS
jgi:small subunit ribosomal protein S8